MIFDWGKKLMRRQRPKAFKLAEVKFTHLSCKLCKAEWTVHKSCTLSRTMVAFVKNKGVVQVCPICKRTDGIEIGDIEI